MRFDLGSQLPLDGQAEADACFESADWRPRCNAQAKRAQIELNGKPLAFIDWPPGQRLSAREYEQMIFSGATVPCRDTEHDRANACAWLRWPKIKAAINRRHVHEPVLLHRRTAVADALTLLDEHGALLFTTDAWVIEALRERRWTELFVSQRSRLSSDARLGIVGHGLAIKLDQPHKSLTAHVLPVLVAGLAPGQWEDRAVAVLEAVTTTKDLLPLPVMGWPGACSENNHPGFYDDPHVFRARAVPCRSR